MYCTARRRPLPHVVWGTVSKSVFLRNTLAMETLFSQFQWPGQALATKGFLQSELQLGNNSLLTL